MSYNRFQIKCEVMAQWHIAHWPPWDAGYKERAGVSQS